MKIALVIYQFVKEKGGVERYVFNLTKQLLQRHHEVHVFAHRFSQEQNFSLSDLHGNKKLTFHYVPAITLWSPLKYWTFALNAPKVVKNTGIKFDIVHGFTQTLFQDIYRVGGGCHWDYMMHTYPLMQSMFGKIILCLNPRHLSLLLLERIIFKRKCYKKITCISEQCKQEIVHHYKLAANNIEVIYNGVDINEFTPLNRARYRDAIRAKYMVVPDEVLLLFVGSGFKRKGLKHGIDALSLIDRNKKIKLLVVGKGKVSVFRKYAKEKGVADKVIFTGVYKHICEIYAAGDIFVFPSEYDAFGTACLEAMASGLPVIASKTSGASEIITHGEDGYVINHPIDSNEIASHINSLLEKETRERMGSSAREKSEMYSLEANIEKTLSIYNRVLNCNF